MTREETFHEICTRLGVKIPPVPQPVGVYQPVIVAGGFAFLSGQISKNSEGQIIRGKLGEKVSLEEGKRAAQCALLQALSLIQSLIRLERVERVVRLVGYVQSSPGFYEQSDVMNAASEILVEVFGEPGRHARTSIGAASLPLNAAVEIEMTLKLQ